MGRPVLLLLLFAYSSILLAHHLESGALFPKSRVGCFSNSALALNKCSQQLLHFEILKTLNYSKQTKRRQKLNGLILERAKFFLKRQKFDYTSVVNLMVFPVKRKLSWLKQFQKLRGGESFGQIAIARALGKRPRHCRGKRTPKKFREICRLKL